MSQDAHHHPSMPSAHPPAPASETTGTISTRGSTLQTLLSTTKSQTQVPQRARKYAGAGNAGGMSLSSKAPFGQRRDDVVDRDLELGRTSTRLSQIDTHVPHPPPGFPLSRGSVVAVDRDRELRRLSVAPSVLMTPQMRSQRLIGNSNPRYQWEQYYRTEEDLGTMRKPIRKYYERNNYLVQQYMYIDKLLDSSLPHNLIQEYHWPEENNNGTINEEHATPDGSQSPSTPSANGGTSTSGPKVVRTKSIYKVPPGEQTPLLDGANESDGVPDIKAGEPLPMFQPEDDTDSSARIVSIAIYVNLAANTLLLGMKIIVTVMTSSLSVLASLVDAVLDFLSTFIVWTTTTLIARGDRDPHNYPVGRRRLEPIGVLVFSVIMITSFAQVALEAIQRLAGPGRDVVELSPSAIAIMATTVVVKGLCWLWCRLINNSSVQALAQDAMTDVVFNTFSIIFPLVGHFFHVWWLDPLGGLLLSLYVIIAWSLTTRTHILNLTGRAASKDEHNILLYLTMRFAHTILGIQGLAAYHAGDKINVEVDIVLEESMSLRDSHDLGESLQYVLESVPGVERAFVHTDYASQNLPSHMKP